MSNMEHIEHFLRMTEVSRVVNENKLYQISDRDWLFVVIREAQMAVDEACAAKKPLSNEPLELDVVISRLKLIRDKLERLIKVRLGIETIVEFLQPTNYHRRTNRFKVFVKGF